MPIAELVGLALEAAGNLCRQSDSTNHPPKTPASLGAGYGKGNHRDSQEDAGESDFPLDCRAQWNPWERRGGSAGEGSDRLEKWRLWAESSYLSDEAPCVHHKLSRWARNKANEQWRAEPGTETPCGRCYLDSTRNRCNSTAD